MWTKLIDLILQWWKDKPRKDLVASVVHLRDKMQNCQQWYEKYQSAKEKGDVEKMSYPNPRVEWVRAVGDLGDAIEELDGLFAIFSPEARRQLQSYRWLESLELIAEGVLGTTSEALGTRETDIDIVQGQLSPTFKAALDTLDSFIRSTFKVDEIYAVSRQHPA